MGGGEIEHKCFLSVAHSLHDAYAMAESQMHRGKDSTGLFAWGPEGIDVLKWIGPVNAFGNRALQRIFPARKYHTFGIHGRYRSAGSTKINLDEGHPHILGGIKENRGSHIYIKGCKKVLIHNGQIESRFFEGMDKSNLKTECDSEGLLHFYDQYGIEELIKKIPDGYTLAVADVNNNGTIIARGRHGLKPGCYGTKDGYDLFASESVALRELRATSKGDLVPGAIYYLRPDGEMVGPRQVVLPSPRHCKFEIDYSAHPHSLIEGVSVLTIRRALGEKAAEEFHPEDIDYVSFVPETPKEAAAAYAEKRKIPFVELFYKINGNRSFQESTQKAREASIGSNLWLLPHASSIIKGKTVFVMDDSFVRGTVAMRTKNLLYDVGHVNKAYLYSYVSPIGLIGDDGIARGCDFGGVDMPSKETEHHKFFARGRTLEQMSETIGAPVNFLSRKAAEEVYREKGLSPDKLCMYCMGGEHPFRDFQNK